MTPAKDLITHRPSPETLISMLADKPLPAASISDIPATPHHHLTCESCGILLACFDLRCGKTTGICHDCATGERPAWSARDAVERYEKKQAEIARLRLIQDLSERLRELPNEALVRVASFVNEL